MTKLYTVKGRKTIAKGLSLEQAAEVAIDAGGHLSIIDETSGNVAIADTDGDYMTIGATEKLLIAYEHRPVSHEPHASHELLSPRLISAPKRRK
jgi:hypothetical protein